MFDDDVEMERPVHDTVGLTGLQLSILDVLWDRGEATTQEVWEHLNRERTLALTTVATLLSPTRAEVGVGPRSRRTPIRLSRVGDAIGGAPLQGS